MLPLQMESEQMVMSITVNGTHVPLPNNWHVPAGKEAAAVKVAPVVDITHLVLGEETLFHLVRSYTGPRGHGAVVGHDCVRFADEVSVADLATDLAGRYRKSVERKRTQHSSGGMINVTEGYVRISCPLTSLPMQVPARGVHCEHLQCMELLTVLTACARTNVWNCPICFAAMRPSEVWVNYRLQEWLCAHHADVARVEYVVETPLDKPLKVLYLTKKEMRTEEVVDVDA
ncbi:hypothetical protein STCU_03671 [Strigomonas culicis]|uniref:SP-RING-type domain-containing protein n=1 Tax=Strigomonas culicis TaxID=28005 RepID=S9UJP3_9TRYP|nr:hypothetical protein STCU_03671 [Strigomonas culicis]|eukprot:EPY31032.1 hypothetical protein STCU_03671 [Strigomonas culicis]